MPDFPSLAPTPELAALFPTRLPDPEALVYEYTLAATQQNLATGVPALSFYADRDRSAAEGLRVDVARGWPAYPGKVPAIGVATGTEGENDQQRATQGGFAGTAVHYDDDGQPVGAAEYYSQPLSIPVIVQLIHENRDERDRLHNELRRILFPLESWLPARDPQITGVSVAAEKTEAGSGPEEAEAPFYLYISLFTITVQCEMLEARRVFGPEALLGRIDVQATPADSGS